MLRDILDKAIDIAGIPISDRQFITAFNDAVHDIAMMYDTAKVGQTQTIICEDVTATYPLAPGCLKIQRVLTPYGNYFKCFTVRGNKEIKFAVMGTFTVFELFDQAPVASMNDESDIDLAYYKSIAEYVASKALRKTDPERSKEIMKEAASDADIANRNIRRADNPNKRVRAPLWW